MAEEKKEKPEGNAANRPGQQDDTRRGRDRMMDRTLEDSYPASDPPSSIPDPEEDSEAA